MNLPASLMAQWTAVPTAILRCRRTRQVSARQLGSQSEHHICFCFFTFSSIDFVNLERLLAGLSYGLDNTVLCLEGQ